MIAKKTRDQLLSNGFCKIPRMLTIDMLNKLRKATDLLLDLQTTEEKATHRSQGSSIEFNNTSDTLKRSQERVPDWYGYKRLD